MALIFYLSLRKTTPGEQLFAHFDKVSHFFAYAFMSFLLHLVLEKKYAIRNFAICFFIGSFIEYLQSLTGYRYCEVNDLIANTLGAIFGIVLFKFPFFQKKLN